MGEKKSRMWDLYSLSTANSIENSVYNKKNNNCTFL
jgi:hypothetical protein